ncbi:nucleotidyltransferase domain-containing protein [Paenibacillus sp. MBLB2552]|uniref:Nucleotidyltransferase domain-containing protein n=1 Tax=Paenibacillus mellifer TaxID=2937794 RepID=A0A9X1XUQ6_9BACL|nr:nucleotidyltransferase domain-containing protein [Paenibacillus mellifer]MCK8485697.1 nucleotidyltransferase domain-containing protein [Paenibacillus mellifer]
MAAVEEGQPWILKQLRQTEEAEQMRILYACEAGSRAWAYASAASDYDVRFIYVRPVEWYLSIGEKRDVIELPISDGCEGGRPDGDRSGPAQPGDDGELDMAGWDLRKALSLLGKGNPTLFEWLASPIVYTEVYGLRERLEALAPQVFSAKAAMYHYLHMAKRNLRMELAGEQVKPKAYLHVLRPLLACAWVERCGTPPPLEIELLAQAALPAQGEGLREEIALLLTRKRAEALPKPQPRLLRLDEYLAERLVYYEQLAPALESGNRDINCALIDVLDGLFRSVLQEVWGVPL